MSDIAWEAVKDHGAVQKVSELRSLIEWLPGGLKRVLEIGSKDGGTLWLWRQLAPEVVSIDIEPVPFEGEGVTLIQGDSHEVSLRGPSFDLIFIDGDHTYEGAKQDFQDFSPLAPIIVLHDIVRGDDGRGVDRLWAELYEKHPAREWIDPKVWTLPSGEQLTDKDGGIGVVLL
jgi:Methyltransferase domain